MTMIRMAKEADIPRLVEMGQRFRGETSYAKHLADNPEQMAQLGRMLLARDGLILSEKNGKINGMFGYVMHAHFISGETFAGEVFWWQEPESRGDGLRLLREAEKLAKARGAKYMHMIAPTAQVARVYEHFGYEFIESTFQRAL